MVGEWETALDGLGSVFGDLMLSFRVEEATGMEFGSAGDVPMFSQMSSWMRLRGSVIRGTPIPSALDLVKKRKASG